MANGHMQQILYSCYFTRSREGEQFVPEHVFSYQIAGSLELSDGTHTYTFRQGDFRFTRRNQLLKFTKYPPEGGEFKSISVYLDQATLRSFCMEYGYQPAPRYPGNAIADLKPDPLFKNYMDSLLPYLVTGRPVTAAMQSLKLREAILLLLESNAGMKDILFDFSEPGKIDLEAFMNRNFHFNVQLSRFAYLTGRSLATFKRDFEKIFSSTPGHWLQQRRLQEAYFLIKEKGRAPSDVYLDLGFADLSHFSHAFKKTYGVAPSRV